MKNPRQYRDSAMFTFIGYVGIIIVILAVLFGTGNSPTHNKEVVSDPHEWNQGECGDTLTPQDSLELIEPDAIYYDTLLDIDMDCGGSDEYIMWIGDNGDTIWE